MPTPAISQAILSLLLENNREYSPSELLEALQERKLEEAEIKEAVAYLIRNHEIEMTADRRLRMQAHAHA